MKKTKKKGNRNGRSSAADFLDTPSSMASPPNDSATSPIFSKSKKKNIFLSPAKTNHILRSRAKTGIGSSTSNMIKSPSQKNLSTISDLKDLASSRLHELKSHIDHSHSQIVKDMEASSTRLLKRFKLQTQASQQVMDDAEKEYKKISERISESQNAMKASFDEFMAHEQASASRVYKTSMNELSQSFEKAIDTLRSRYGIPST